MDNKIRAQTFIFLGSSGCGKGTQAKLMLEYLKKTHPSRNTLYIQTGAEFREFIKGDSLTQKMSKDIYDKGQFQPEFLAIYMWANALVKNYTKDEHLVLDGMPRKYHEAGVLDSIFSFYKMGRPHVVYIELSEEESRKRLAKRGRFDDTEAEITERLSWFKTEVIPTLDFFKNNPDYEYIVVNGNQPPEDVHKEVLSKAKIA
jgi:adenylate kinase